MGRVVGLAFLRGGVFRAASGLLGAGAGGGGSTGSGGGAGVGLRGAVAGGEVGAAEAMGRFGAAVAGGVGFLGGDFLGLDLRREGRAGAFWGADARLFFRVFRGALVVGRGLLDCFIVG